MIGGQPPSAYKVELNGHVQMLSHNISSERLSIRFRELSSKQDYEWKVTCFIQEVACPGPQPTFTASTVCKEPHAPVLVTGTPSCIELTHDGRQRWNCTLTWQEPEQVFCPGQVSYILQGTVSRTTTSFSVEFYLDGDEPFNIQLRAKNSDNFISPKVTVSGGTGVLVPQFGNQQLQVFAHRPHCVKLTWSAPQYPGGTITHYLTKCTSGGWEQENRTRAYHCRYEPYTEVTCYLMAVNNRGNSSQLTGTGRTGCDEPVFTENIRYTEAYDSVRDKVTIIVDVNEETITSHCASLKPLEYKVLDRQLSTDNIIRNLNATTEYTVTVKATNNMDLFTYEYVNVTTGELLIPEEPSILLTTTEESCVNLEVTAPKRSNETIIHYMFNCTPFLGLPKQTTSNTTSASICELPSATRIDCSVTALNSFGESKPTFVATFTQLKLQSPDASYLRIGERPKGSTTVEMVIRKVQVENIDVSSYFVLIEKSSQHAVVKRDNSQQECSVETITNNQSADSASADRCYVTAKISADEFEEELVFNIGDGGDYGGFNNRPLDRGVEYNAYLLLQANVGSESTTLNKLLSPVSFKFLPVDPQDSLSPGTIAGAVIGPLLFIVVVVCLAYFIYRRRKALPGNEKETREFETLQLERNPVAGPSSDGGSPEPPRVERGDRAENELEQQGLYGNIGETGVRSEAIHVDKLGWYIRTNNEAIRSQYAKLTKLPLPAMTAALSSENKGKCRYKNLYPGDNHRVKLQRDHTHDTDFINASFLRGYKKKVQYIASMGPSNKAVTCDFWLMIWQQNPSVIVMVTKAEENTTMKCWQYWPEEEKTTKEFGEFAITCRSKEIYSDFSTSYLEVVKNGEKRVIPHFNYLTWPDHGVPDVEVFVAFHRLVKSVCPDNDQPLLVHCSAGVGRTGTYVALDYLLEQAKEERMVDAFRCVAEMRERRPKMIQTVDQYILLHQALYESISTQTFSCSPSDLQQRLSLHQTDKGKASDLISAEYKHILDRISVLDLSYKSGKMMENREKNRFAEILPCEDYRMFLSDGKEGNYINAVAINGYRAHGKWIATQSPLSYTVVDFWQLMLEQDVKVVVQLEGTSTSFYPLTDNTHMSIDPFIINRKSSKDGEHVKTIEILLQKDTQQEKAVSILMVKNWEANTLPSTALFISLQEMIERLVQCTGSTKICVVCQDGSSRCGLYTCAHNAIEKLKVEQQVDIYYPVVMAKLRRPQFVSDMDEYSYLYQVIKDYADDFGEYANFR